LLSKGKGRGRLRERRRDIITPWAYLVVIITRDVRDKGGAFLFPSLAIAKIREGHRRRCLQPCEHNTLMRSRELLLLGNKRLGIIILTRTGR
jgi:hypothetical protein